MKPFTIDLAGELAGPGDDRFPLALASRGNLVSQIQVWLNEVSRYKRANGSPYWSEIPVHGVFDVKTGDAVAAWCRSEGWTGYRTLTEARYNALRDKVNVLRMATPPTSSRPATGTPSTSPKPAQTAPSAYSGTVLRRGSRGPAVEDLQRRLNAAGFSTQGIDGDFGANTERAVKALQQASGLRADGVVGPDTWRALGGTSSPASPSGVQKTYTPPDPPPSYDDPYPPAYQAPSSGYGPVLTSVGVPPQAMYVFAGLALLGALLFVKEKGGGDQ